MQGDGKWCRALVPAGLIHIPNAEALFQRLRVSAKEFRGHIHLQSEGQRPLRAV